MIQDFNAIMALAEEMGIDCPDSTPAASWPLVFLEQIWRHIIQIQDRICDLERQIDHIQYDEADY